MRRWIDNVRLGNGTQRKASGGGFSRGRRSRGDGFRISTGVFAAIFVLFAGIATSIGVVAGFRHEAVSLLLLTIILAIFVWRLAGKETETIGLIGEREERLDQKWESGEHAEQLRSLLDALGDIALTRDLDGRILYANQPFREATGIGDPIGLTLDEIGPLEDRMTDETGAARPVVIGDGDDRRWFEWRDFTVRDPETDDLLIQSIGRDVTERKRTEKDLVDQRERAETSSAAKSRFLAMVSHEIRTPLNGILGITQLLSRTQLTPEQTSYTSAVRESGHALLQLIEDLLDFSSMEAGRLTLRTNTGNLVDLVDRVVELTAPRAHDKGIEIATYLAPDVPGTILADHGRLRQILLNLVGNAIKFTENGGVLVDIGMESAGLTFRVTDTGPGMAEDDLLPIFEEFEQADNSSTRKHGGAGLGLAISLRLAQAMGGTLTAQSTLGKGSTFTLTLPVSAAERSQPSARTVMHPLDGVRMLLVAPQGPTSTALTRLVRDLGARAATVESIEDLDGKQPTAIVVDSRLADRADEILESAGIEANGEFTRIMMLTPGERSRLEDPRFAEYKSWLTRPLRTASVIKVLTGAFATPDDDTMKPRAVGAGKAAESAVATEPAIEKDGFNVLLAEDNPVNALLVRSALNQAGHHVTVVGNGHELVRKICDPTPGAAQFDIILTDNSMPGIGGGEAIRIIRAFEDARGHDLIPIIMLSADGQAATREQALKDGADEYLEKPLDPDDLTASVERLVSLRRRNMIAIAANA